jgi:hypothetical protein
LVPKQKFHERFGIHVDLEEARRRLINRLKVAVIDVYVSYENRHHVRSIAFFLGEPFDKVEQVKNYAKNSYINTLLVAEAIYKTFNISPNFEYLCSEVENSISRSIAASEVDLGISWKDGIFIKTGAEYLDKKLIRDPLDWLISNKYSTVYEPLKKSLKHFLESEKDNTKLYDVITDAYEALEALAKIVTGKDVTLDKNRELLISKLKISPDYKEMLKSYIEYAHKYRHALKKGEARKPLVQEEVESYIYLTGVFIRLGITCGSQKG